MAKDSSIGGSNWPNIDWGAGEGVGAMSNPTGRGRTLDPRQRCAPPAPVEKKKKLKARSSVTPW